MMLSLSGFRALYPEFVNTPDAMVQAFLDRAEKRTDAGIWGDKADEGHGLLAAHLLAIAPMGQFARLATDAGETVYGRERKRLEALVTAGLRGT